MKGKKIGVLKNGAPEYHLGVFLTYNDLTFDDISSISFDANDIKQHTAVINGVITFNGSSDYLEIFARINVIAGTPTIQDFNEKNVIFGAYRIGA